MNSEYEVARSVAELLEVEGMQTILGEVDQQIQYVEEEIVRLSNVVEQMNKLSGEQIIVQTAYMQGQIKGLQYIKNRLTYYKKQSKELQHE